MHKLIAGKPTSTDPGDMWKAGMRTGGRVTMVLPPGAAGAAWLRVWNYNAGALEVSLSGMHLHSPACKWGCTPVVPPRCCSGEGLVMVSAFARADATS